MIISLAVNAGYQLLDDATLVAVVLIGEPSGGVCILTLDPNASFPASGTSALILAAVGNAAGSLNDQPTTETYRFSDLGQKVSLRKGQTLQVANGRALLYLN